MSLQNALLKLLIFFLQVSAWFDSICIYCSPPNQLIDISSENILQMLYGWRNWADVLAKKQLRFLYAVLKMEGIPYKARLSS